MASGKGLLVARGFHVPHVHGGLGLSRSTVWCKTEVLKAGSNTFFLASLRFCFCLHLQLKGMEKEDFTPRKRQKRVVESTGHKESESSGFRSKFGW